MQPEQVAPEEKVDEIIDAGPANAIVWEQDGAKMALIPTGSGVVVEKKGMSE